MTLANRIAEQLGMPVDDVLVLQLAHTKLLAAAAMGAIDLNALAREEIANRGVGLDGRWVGFEAAARQVAVL